MDTLSRLATSSKQDLSAKAKGLSRDGPFLFGDPRPYAPAPVKAQVIIGIADLHVEYDALPQLVQSSISCTRRA